MGYPERTFMPASHNASLDEIENGFWWYVGRIELASEWIASWMQRRGIRSIATYTDIGCGRGGFAHAIRSQFDIQHWTLVDGDRTVLALNSRYPDAETVCLNLEKPFHLSRPPQLVTCMDVLEHLSDDRSFLGQVFAEMPSGGAMVLSVPAHQVLFSEWDRQLGHHRRYSKRELRSKLEEAGFKLHELRYSWSFLAPVIPVRKMRKKRYQADMSFEQAPKWVNTMMITLSRAERSIAHFVSPPFGTSLTTLVTKP